MKRSLLAGVALLWAFEAFAHSPLETTVPAHEATVTAVPDQITLSFRDGIRLTKVTMTHAAHQADLDLQGHSGFLSDYAIPMQPMGAGTYQIEWRGLGNDGHLQKGVFSFTVAE